MKASSLILLLATALLLAGCDVVSIRQVSPQHFAEDRRSDVLSSGQLSDDSQQALNVVGLEHDACQQNFARCTHTLLYSDGLNDEHRLAALSEIWLQRALQPADTHDAALDDELQAARYAYAYLFYTAREPGERAFELRQTRVLDIYNYAVEQAAQNLFARLPQWGTGWQQQQIAGWTLLRPSTDVYLGDGNYVPQTLIPASSLRFDGVRNIYRRDGFGSEFVAVGTPPPERSDQPWRTPYVLPLTAVLAFPGKDLAEVLTTQQVQFYARDPYLDTGINLDGKTIPLAANFTAPYGVWLARSGFARQSLRSLFGREGGIAQPRVLMMQPYDPQRLTVIMLHGLASSPEAWINTINEVMGDAQLRRSYQVWQVYYPTNAPVAVNLLQIRRALDATFAHFDPSGRARASHDVVLIGHSMGGVLARLLVSSSGTSLWTLAPARKNLSATQKQQLHDKLAPYLEFSPMPQVTRAVFIAAPHRGTPVARWGIARWIGSLVRLPVTLLQESQHLLGALQPDANTPQRLPNSIDNLSDTDPFIRASSQLPIAKYVHYHSIIGVYKPDAPLADSDDGVVPYASAHLDGADSELAVPSWHNVQENPQAIMELRRILRLHALLLHCLQAASGPLQPCSATAP